MVKFIKKDLKDTLLKSYVKDVDFIFLNINNDDKIDNGVNPQNHTITLKNKGGTSLGARMQGGRPKKIVLLTIDCFKLLCMRSKTKKSEEVRKYYLELEKLVDKYKDYIIQIQKEKILKLEYDLNPVKLPNDGYLYVYNVDDYYRIGASNNLKLRFKTHNSSQPHKIKPILTKKCKNPFRLETCVNNLLAEHRIINKKDFFKVDFSILLNAINDCDDMITKYKCKECNIKLDNNQLNSHLLNKHKNYSGIFKIKYKLI